ncbi:NAD-dependent epimerase/dehydratase family protein [Leptolyngbya sp. AN02str]|uniref:NAD-dependent epimerase/dehydratase family protein n=1 Tax=Leptolyngbya sp. AN02str TaxID=3423363 RepID=UPI003D31B7EF
MNILTIGATSFVGSHVTRQLIEQGHQVALFHRGKTSNSDLDSLVHFYSTHDQLSTSTPLKTRL